MSAPVNELACPTCGSALGPYDPICPSCGAKTKDLLPLVNLEPRLREIRTIATGAIAQATAYVANAHRVGAEVDLAEDLLAMAKKAAAQADFPVALDLASRSGEEAESLTVQFEALQGRMKQARRLIETAKEDGADTSDCEELLLMASEAAVAGEYKSALRYALKAAQRAERGREKYQAWKVEIGDWLK